MYLIHEETLRMLELTQHHYHSLSHMIQTASSNALTMNSTLQSLQYRIGELQMSITSLSQNNGIFNDLRVNLNQLRGTISESCMHMQAGFNTLENKAKEMHQLIEEYETIARDPVVKRIISDIREFADRIDDVIRDGG